MAIHPIYEVIYRAVEYPQASGRQVAGIIEAITEWVDDNPTYALPWEEPIVLVNGQIQFRRIEQTKKLELELTASQAKGLLLALRTFSGPEIAKTLRNELVQLFEIEQHGSPVPELERILDEEEEIERQASDLIGGPDGCRSA